MPNTTERQFLALLRYGLQGRMDDLADRWETADWPAIGRQARRQAVAGVTYDGIALLPPSQRPPRGLLLEWYARTVRIERENALLDGRLVEAVGRYRHMGLSPVLLKGQGVAQYYRLPAHRQPGDIDLFFPEGYEAANAEILRWDGVVSLEETTYHRGFLWNGVEIENHRLYVDFYHRRNRRAWQRVAAEVPLTGEERYRVGTDFSVPVPAPQMNAVYLFLHLLHHFLQVGVGLRQVCDWVRFVQTRHEAIDPALFAQCIEELRLRRAVTALAYVGETYLGLPPKLLHLPTHTPEARHYGEMLLRDVLDRGNFGQDTELWRSFRRGRFWKNIQAYRMALCRQFRLYPFCPAEVRAYPLEWLKRHVRH